MATFYQWKSKHPEYKLLYYICGTEYALVQEVKDAVSKQYGFPNTRIINIHYPNPSKYFADIESIVLMEHQEPVVICIDNAKEFTDSQWQKIEDYAWAIVNGDLWNIKLIIVTNEEKPDTKQPKFRPFVECGRYVECKELSVDGLRKYCVTDYSLTEKAVDYLLELVSFNFVRLNNELEKLAITFPNISITEQHIDEVVVFSADDLLLRYLLYNDSTKARAVAHVIKEDAVGYILATLARKLSFLYLMFLKDVPGTNAHILAAKLNVQSWQLLEYFPLKKLWSIETIRDKLRVLVEAEKFYMHDKNSVIRILTEFW